MSIEFFREALNDRADLRWTPAGGETGPPPRRPASRTAMGWLREAWRRHRSRTWLSQLDQRMLRDIGITWSEAEREINKPFWRV
ncbi:MAG: DUF1127 domain-containing protein [Acetobacteraceae bacterium]